MLWLAFTQVVSRFLGDAALDDVRALAGTLGVCCLLLGAQTHASAQVAANDAAAEGARQFAVTCAGCHGAGKQYLAVTAGDDVIAFALR